MPQSLLPISAAASPVFAAFREKDRLKQERHIFLTFLENVNEKREGKEERDARNAKDEREPERGEFANVVKKMPETRHGTNLLCALRSPLRGSL